MRRQPPALTACVALCAALALWGAPATARDAGRTPGAGLAAAAPAANGTAAGDAHDCVPAERAGGKVIDIYWTRGPDHGRITGGEVDHYVDLNLVVRTRGYLEGDCVEATVQAADGGDIVEGRKTLLLHGRVDKAGVAYFKEPLRRYTLILSDGDEDAPGQNAPGSRSAP